MHLRDIGNHKELQEEESQYSRTDGPIDIALIYTSIYTHTESYKRPCTEDVSEARCLSWELMEHKYMIVCKYRH